MNTTQEKQLISHILQLLKQTNQIPTFTHKILKDQESTYFLVLDFDIIESTHTLAELVDSSLIPNNVVMVLKAKTQTKGVGQSSAKYYSPSGNLHITLVFNVNDKFNFSLTTLTFSLSVVDSLYQYIESEKMSYPEGLSSNAPEFRLKWINDVYWENKKIAGVIACSSSISNNDSSNSNNNSNNSNNDNTMKLIVSAGVNLNVAPQVKDISTSCLKNFLRTSINIDHFSNIFLTNFKHRKNQLSLLKDYDSITKDLDSLLLFKGEEVTINSLNGQILGQGVFTGINSNGAAILESNSNNNSNSNSNSNSNKVSNEYYSGKMRRKEGHYLATLYDNCKCLVSFSTKRSRKFYYFFLFSVATVFARMFITKRIRI